MASARSTGYFDWSFDDSSYSAESEPLWQVVFRCLKIVMSSGASTLTVTVDRESLSTSRKAPPIMSLSCSFKRNFKGICKLERRWVASHHVHIQKGCLRSNRHTGSPGQHPVIEKKRIASHHAQWMPP